MRGKSTLADLNEVGVCSVSCQTSAFCDVERRELGCTEERLKHSQGGVNLPALRRKGLKSSDRAAVGLDF